jgi:WD40 repeat protein
VCSVGKLWVWLGVSSCSVGFAAGAETQKVTYEDHVLPIFRDNCLKCHNPDKLKGDLDLTSFSSAVKGGGSGATLNAGDPESSQLFKSITHADEPSMPPNAKLSERDIVTIRRWIEGGLLQGAGSKALAANKPAVDLTLKSSSIGKPEGPPPMPAGLVLDSVVRTARGSTISALASSPWAPVVALGGTKQITLHDSSALDFLGVLPFPEGVVCDVKFSRNGKLLVAGGGRGGHSGVVAVWDITTGQRVITVGDQFDSVLAADISADQQRVALGGPDRVLKVYLTKDGSLEHRMKKHTEWVTAVEFSPNGKLLASGDRNGGLVVWEAGSGQEMFTLVGHKAAIAAVTWRSDSEMLASASEDGTVKLWKASDGSALRSLTAHAGGVLTARFGPDGKIVSGGRDNKVQIWETSGKNAGTLGFKGDLPTRVSFTADGRRIVVSDWQGQVTVWDTKSGKAIGELEANPLTVAERVQRGAARVAELQTGLDRATSACATTEREIGAIEPVVAKLNADLDAARSSLAAKDAELTKVVAPDDSARAQAETIRNEIKGLHDRIAALQAQITNREKQRAALTKKFQDAKTEVAELDARLASAKTALAKWRAVGQTTPSSSAPRKVSQR